MATSHTNGARRPRPTLPSLDLRVSTLEDTVGHAPDDSRSDGAAGSGMAGQVACLYRAHVKRAEFWRGWRGKAAAMGAIVAFLGSPFVKDIFNWLVHR